MGFKCGIVGLPNVGKSTLFNALTASKNAEAANFPFCTTDPKIGIVDVVDERLDQLTKLSNSKKKIYTNITFVDIAGLVKGASKGEGLGNKFLSHIREVDAIIHLVRCFESDKITHVNSKINPVEDLETIKTEIILSDLDIIQKKLEKGKKKLLQEKEIKMLEEKLNQLNEGKEIVVKDKLEKELDTKVVLLSARKNQGFETLKSEIKNYRNLSEKPAFDINEIDPEYFTNLQKTFPGQSVYKLWLLITQDINFSKLERNKIDDKGRFKTQTESYLKKLQQRETIKRYQIINNRLKETYVKDEKKATGLRSVIDRVLLHRVWGYLIFFSILLLIFQVIFDWSSIPMDFIDSTFVSLSQSVKSGLPQGVFTSLLAEGVIPGLAGILIFVPQIALLFFFISILEETGYMSRVVFLMDRTLKKFGLGGKSLIPLVSGVACAIPAVMATRNIENWKDRLITILVIPFMTCSARLPVYLILISLVIPADKIFGVNYQSLTLMGLYILGFLLAIISSTILKTIIKRDSKSYLVLEMPEYKLPLPKNIFLNVWTKTKSFIVEAGKIIFAISILLWIMASYGPGDEFKNADTIVTAQYENIEISQEDLELSIDAYRLEHSFIGLVGKSIEPAIAPLGYDWKIGIALVTSFAAREVFVGTLSTIYSVGSENQDTIKTRMSQETDSNGNKIFNLPTGLSLMIFYAFAMQCMSTLAIVKKETNSWKWPLIQLIFMTILAYFASLFVFQILS